MANIKKSDIDRGKKWLMYKKNPQAFIETECMIPSVGGDELITLYKPQVDILNSFYYGGEHNQIWLKSRQLGFSTLTQLMIVHLCIFFTNVVMGIASRDGAEASDFCRKAIDIIDKLPKWLQPNSYRYKNVQSFCTCNGNQLHSSAIPPSNPGSLFRGKSIALLVLDEVAHIERIDDAWTGVAPALSKAQRVAKQKNIPYGTIFLSTPNKPEGTGKFFHSMWVGALEGTNNFSPKTIHWKEIPELKNDPTWYKEQCDILNNDQRKIRQELELEFIGSDSCMFNEIVQSTLQESTRNSNSITKIKMRQGGILYELKDIDVNKVYLVGVDTASAAGSDFSTIQILEYETMHQVLEYKGKLEPKKFAEVLKSILLRVPKNIIIIENTGGFGITVLNELQFDKEKRYNLYYETDTKNGKITYGLSTNVKSRPLIVDALYETVTEDPTSIKSDRLAAELISLVYKNNKAQADKGYHDDLVMAYAFICYIRKYKLNFILQFDFSNDDGEIVNAYDPEINFYFDINDVNTEAVRQDELTNFMNQG